MKLVAGKVYVGNIKARDFIATKSEATRRSLKAHLG
jgi:hypothetical protein